MKMMSCGCPGRLMNKGDEIIVYIPEKLAYGETGFFPDIKHFDNNFVKF